MLSPCCEYDFDRLPVLTCCPFDGKTCTNVLKIKKSTSQCFTNWFRSCKKLNDRALRPLTTEGFHSDDMTTEMKGYRYMLREGEAERRIQFHPPLALSWLRCKPPTSPWLLGNMSCFCWEADRRLTSAVRAATYWPWREEVKWSLWTLSSELSLPCLICPRGPWQNWDRACGLYSHLLGSSKLFSPVNHIYILSCPWDHKLLVCSNFIL